MTRQITRIIVNGASGRTGARICSLALRDDQIELVAALAHPASTHLGRPLADAPPSKKPLKIAAKSDAPADVIIDFSSPAGTRDALAMALSRSAAILVGTTALDEPTLTALQDASKKIPVLIAPNTSVGIVALADAASRIARALGPGFAASIVETHHSAKKDAPSGTALRLARAIRDSGGSLPDNQLFSIRAGDVVGEHTIRFTGHGESIILEHRVMSRDVFAHGALRAATWLRARAAGMWTMEDVLAIATARG